MAEYVGGKPVVVERGDKLDMTLPKPIATVKFDAYSVGTYIVEVAENGNWTSRRYIGTMDNPAYGKRNDTDDEGE